MASPDKKEQPSPEVLARWERDVQAIGESIGLMLSNELAQAEQRLQKATEEVAQRQINFAAGDHDMRGAFAFVSALMSLVNGLASLELNQLEIVLSRVWAADELLALDGDWPGRTVLRGLCMLVAGIVEIMQGGVTRGIWHVLRSWLWLRTLETEALEFQGHERSCVRSTALLALGVFNLFTSMLPPAAMQAAGWLTGFTGGREVALSQLKSCWEEDGIQAPFAALALVGFAVDVSSFLGEIRTERAVRYVQARQILDWAAERYPGAFFFQGLESGYRAATQDLPGAIATLDGVRSSVAALPAFLFLVNVRTATLQAANFDWAAAGHFYKQAVEVHQSVSRRALCPVLSMNAHLCYVFAGKKEEADQMLETCRSYRHEKKKWSPIDNQSLAHAELAFQTAGGIETPSAAGSDGGSSTASPLKKSKEEERWRPKLILLMKLCLTYRAVNFMTPEKAQVFLDLVRAETDLCRAGEGDGEEDTDGVLMGYCIQAEALRQMEEWDEALRLAAEGVALGAKVSKAGRHTGALHFCQLVVAYANYAKGNLAAAKEALSKLDTLGSGDYFYAKQVEFKATRLKQLVGAEFEDSFTDLSIGARSRSRLVTQIPEGTDSVEWEFVLDEFSVTFTAIFVPEGGGEAKVLQTVEQHQADAGPLVGNFEPPGPGKLELLFTNSFSFLRGKKVHCRVSPKSLKLEAEHNV